MAIKAIIVPYENIIATKIFMYYLFENKRFNKVVYFYLRGVLEAALLGGFYGLSLYKIIIRINGTVIIIAS